MLAGSRFTLWDQPVHLNLKPPLDCKANEAQQITRFGERILCCGSSVTI